MKQWILPFLCLAAALPAQAALTIEAEDAPLRSVGAPIEGGWNLFSSGEVGGYVRVPAQGIYKVVIRAYGSPVQGVWPEMTLNVDHRPRNRVTVDTPTFREYRFHTGIEAGVHLLTAAFLNDALDPPEDRNLFLDRITVESPEGVGEVRVVDEEEWFGEAKKREEAVFAQVDEAIRKNRMGTATIIVREENGEPVPDAKVTVELKRHDFLFGCNIYMFDHFKTPEQNREYKARFRELFNYATTGFYWVAYERTRGKPNYPYTDKVATWCHENEIRLKGHPLLWAHEAGIPSWSNGQPAPDIQKQRVVDIVQRYQGRIDIWEVVNEPSHLPQIKIDEPQRWAREAVPDAYLIVNDYATFTQGGPPFFELLEKAIKDGVPFDGIGIQAHEPANTAYPLDRVREILDEFATLGKELHITEYTPSSNGKPVLGAPWRGTWTEETQATWARDFYRVCFAHPAVVAITWWDFSDAGSWRPQGGILHSDLTPKPVFHALKELIHGEWNTTASGTTNAKGHFTFHGFHGQYGVCATMDGREVVQEFHVAPGKDNALALTLESE